MLIFFQIFFCVFLFLARHANGYPSYIGYGYSSCLTCHVQPGGGGPINSYARAVQATEISGNLFNQSIQDLENFSEFPVRPFSEKLDFQTSFRGLWLARNIQSSDPSSNWITMQADLAARLHLTSQLQVVGSLGYVPPPRRGSSSSFDFKDTLISREHYVAYRPKRSIGFYAGFLDPVFGLRIPEHNSYIRASLLLNINDQVHGLLTHYSRKTADFYLHLFAGNLYQDSSIRPRGISSQVDFEISEAIRLGASVWWSKSDFRDRKMIAAHMKAKLAKGSSLLLQTSIFRQVLSLKEPEIGSADFAQIRILFRKGIFGLFTFEHFIPDFKINPTHFFRLGPTLEYLPFPKLEIRADFLASKSFDNIGENPIDINFQLQTHWWL